MQNLEKIDKSIPKLQHLSELKKIILENRGMGDCLNKDSFWKASIQDLHNPFLFPQMDVAVERILEAREKNQRIVIFGDYDVDGVSSTALLLRFFTTLGISASYRIPHRVKDGYGMKSYFFDELLEKEVKLVISVDCGTRDIEAIKYAKSIGIDVIVTDHHSVPVLIPEEAIAIISPKIQGTTYPFHGLSGSGVAFKLLSAVVLKLYGETEKYYETLESYIDFAALGTVADMMPLVGENRTIVQLGLKQLPYSKSPGLRKLIAGKSLNNADVIGFHIGPRINAAGRIASAETALKSLISSEIHIDGLLEEIEALNTERKGSTEHFVQVALETVDPTMNPIIFESTEIHHGIMGLVAGKLAERFERPAIVCVRRDGKCVGSARSPVGYHITEAFERVSDCFVAFGGHAQAAGFTLLEDRFPEFVEKIQADALSVLGIISHDSKIKKRGSVSIDGMKHTSVFERVTPGNIDAILHSEILTINLIKEIESIGPFGIGFQKPLFLLHFSALPSWEYMGSGKAHVRFNAERGTKIIGFNIGENLMNNKKALEGEVYLLVELDRETWQNRESLVVHVRDIFAFSL